MFLWVANFCRISEIVKNHWFYHYILMCWSWQETVFYLRDYYLLCFVVVFFVFVLFCYNLLCFLMIFGDFGPPGVPKVTRSRFWSSKVPKTIVFIMFLLIFGSPQGGQCYWNWMDLDESGWIWMDLDGSGLARAGPPKEQTVRGALVPRVWRFCFFALGVW